MPWSTRDRGVAVEHRARGRCRGAARDSRPTYSSRTSPGWRSAFHCSRNGASRVARTPRDLVEREVGHVEVDDAGRAVEADEPLDAAAANAAAVAQCGCSPQAMLTATPGIPDGGRGERGADGAGVQHEVAVVEAGVHARDDDVGWWSERAEARRRRRWRRGGRRGRTPGRRGGSASRPRCRRSARRGGADRCRRRCRCAHPTARSRRRRGRRRRRPRRGRGARAPPRRRRW